MKQLTVTHDTGFVSSGPHAEVAQRVLIFLDVLGWSERIAQDQLSAPISFASALSPFVDGIHSYNREHGTSLQFSLMSDSFVASWPIETPRHHVELIFGVVTNYLVLAVSLGLLVRGAMVTGSLVHDGPICLGEPLIRAYHLERQAGTPRVVVDPDVQAYLGEALGWHNDAPVSPRHRPGRIAAPSEGLPMSVGALIDMFCGHPLETDDDGAVYFNWLWTARISELDGLASAVQAHNAGRTFEAKVATKINWFIEYLNREGRKRGSMPWATVPRVDAKEHTTG